MGRPVGHRQQVGGKGPAPGGAAHGMKIVDLHRLHRQPGQEVAQALGGVGPLPRQAEDDMDATLKAQAVGATDRIVKTGHVVAPVHRPQDLIAVALEADFHRQEGLTGQLGEEIHRRRRQGIGAGPQTQADALGQALSHALIQTPEAVEGRVGVGEGLKVGNEPINPPMPALEEGPPPVPLAGEVRRAIQTRRKGAVVAISTATPGHGSV